MPIIEAEEPFPLEQGYAIPVQEWSKRYADIKIDPKLDTKSTEHPHILGKLALLMYQYEAYATKEDLAYSVELCVDIMDPQNYGVSLLGAFKLRRQMIYRLKHLNVLWLGAEWKLLEKIGQMSKISEELCTKINGFKENHHTLKRRMQYVMKEKKLEMKVEHTFGPDELVDGFGWPTKTSFEHPPLGETFQKIAFKYLHFFFGRYDKKSRCKKVEDLLLNLMPDEISDGLCDDEDESPPKNDATTKAYAFDKTKFIKLVSFCKWLDMVFKILAFHLRRMEEMFITERGRVTRLENEKEFWRKKADRMKATVRKLGKEALTIAVPYQFAVVIRKSQ